MRFHVYKWNKWDKSHTMIILKEEDIENECEEPFGVGYEILILPSKYKDVNSTYLNTLRIVLNARCGEIIYV